MKLKSLLLGSVAAAGLSTGAFAADLGVVMPTLDACDAVGMQGVPLIDHCLTISGSVVYSAKWGDYKGSVVYITSSIGTTTQPDNDAGFFGPVDWDSTVTATLSLEATHNTAFGKGIAHIDLTNTDSFGVHNGVITSSGTTLLSVGNAYLAVGDSTVVTLGRAPSIAILGGDEPLNYGGLFRSDHVGTGVGTAAMPATGGHSIQVVSDLGNGVSAGIALEAIDTIMPDLIGVLSYSGDTFSGHVTGMWDGAVFFAHAAGQVSIDMFTLLGALAIDSTGDWNVLGSASATFDMFTLAVSGEAAAGGEWGVGGSVSADVTDGVTLNLGGRYFDNSVDQAWQGEANVTADLTDTLSAGATVGYIDSTLAATSNVYFEGELTWAPSDSLSMTASGGANSLGAYWVGLSGENDFS
ncbi:MAG: hypothetical protein H6873_08305 [Hyphomicrobiaceae bacterium]|nr:hypothetical protein [Hyphomicrobiaceae bacterium]